MISTHLPVPRWAPSVGTPVALLWALPPLPHPSPGPAQGLDRGKVLLTITSGSLCKQTVLCMGTFV